MIDGGGAMSGVPVKNIGNWGEVKAQAAALLGIRLVDSDVFNVPLIADRPLRPLPARTERVPA